MSVTPEEAGSAGYGTARPTATPYRGDFHSRQELPHEEMVVINTPSSVEYADPSCELMMIYLLLFVNEM
jgi:hypothetical protein